MVVCARFVKGLRDHGYAGLWSTGFLEDGTPRGTSTPGQDQALEVPQACGPEALPFTEFFDSAGGDLDEAEQDFCPDVPSREAVAEQVIQICLAESPGLRSGSIAISLRFFTKRKWPAAACFSYQSKCRWPSAWASAAS